MIRFTDNDGVGHILIRIEITGNGSKNNHLNFDQVGTRKDNAISIVYEVLKALNFLAWKVFLYF